LDLAIAAPQRNFLSAIILPTCTFDIKDNIGSAESKGVVAQVDAHVNDHVALTLGGDSAAQCGRRRVWDSGAAEDVWDRGATLLCA
jgi:hypothetical protein